MRAFLPAALAVVVGLLAGCKRASSEIDRAPSPTALRATPSILDEIKANPKSPWKAYQLRAFQVNHMWGAAGYKPEGENYRAKLTLWDDDAADKNTAVAELFFRDVAQFDPKRHLNPDPNQTGAARPFRLHFPANTLDPILSTLRSANEPVYLYYYDNQWAIGVIVAEPVGVD